MTTLTKRAITYTKKYPGRSATEIANALHARPSSVSSILYRACRAGLLTRREGEASAGPWHRQNGGGPSGGATYYPAASASSRSAVSALERVTGEDVFR
jgi:hypothetical protein